jgi:CoA:oxalate CoA-transferase
VKTVPEAIRQPQVVERHLIKQVDDPVLGSIEVINSAMKYREDSVGVRGHAPTLGEHNDAVLREVLGYDEERIDVLRAACCGTQEFDCRSRSPGARQTKGLH